MEKIKNKASKTFLIAFCCMLFLGVFGCVMVYSASFYSAGEKLNNPTFYLLKQTVGVVIGFLCFIFFYFFDYKKLKKLMPLVVVVSLVLLSLVFVPFIGVENYGARRWIGFSSLTIQPSEIAKFALILFIACYLSKHKKDALKLKTMFPVLCVGGLFCLLIIIEPNMSITMCVGAVMLIMMFVGGFKKKYFAVLGVIVVLFAVFLIFLEPYRIKRLMAFIDPWQSPKGEGYQLIQSLYSLGNGGLFGVGLFSSRQKLLYLPFAESDFIFSIICEEFGAFGAICVVCVFVVLILCILNIARNSNNLFASYLCVGVASVIFVQVAINIAVVTGSIPPTGLPLPFISAGSTSLMVFMSAIGVCLNINKENVKLKNTYQKKCYVN